MPAEADHLLVRDEGVQHGLLGRLDDRLEVRIEVAPRHEPHVVVRAVSLPEQRLGAPAERPGVPDRERDEQVSREVGARGSRSGQAERHPAGEGVTLVRQQRRIGRDHRDDGAGARGRREVLGDRVVVRERLAHRHPGDRELATHAEVRLHEHPDDVPLVAVGERPRCRPRAALVRVAVHPGATADRALLDRAGARGLERPHRHLDRDVAAVDVVQVPVPRLGRHRQQPGIGDVRVVLHGPGDDPGMRDPDGVRVRDRDRAGGRARLLDPARRRSSRRCRSASGTRPRRGRRARRAREGGSPSRRCERSRPRSASRDPPPRRGRR